MKQARIAVLGAGTMGHGIAQLFASHGYRTRVYDPDREQLAAAQRTVRSAIGRTVASESAEEPNLLFTTDLAEAAREADWVFEAAPEVEQVKRELYRQLAPHLKPEAAVASNTSTFALARLAAFAPFADRLVIAHFFNPATLIPLVEVVRSDDTREPFATELMALLRDCGKSPLLLNRDTPGFIANRLQAAIMREACSLLDSGIATAEQIDTAVKEGVGLRWALAGPLEIADYGGLDIWEKVTGHLFPELANDREAPESIRRRVREGRLGTKSGQGFYTYADDPIERKHQAREREGRLRQLLRDRQGEHREG